ncbi:MAG: histidine triad family protein [Actinomycetota bacterium]|nr:histidine triad family protein [Actinomycetota bacterium]
MTDCIFCKIVAGDVPSEQVAESERTYAFRDLQPTAPTHVLVIPREHIENAGAVTIEHAPVMEEMLRTAQEVARAEGVADSGYRLVFNVGDDALNSVPHLHLHVIGGRRMGWPPG